MSETFPTVPDVAELLKLNQQTVRNWVDRGELPAVRVGQRRVRIKRSDLDRLIDNGYTARVPAATALPEPGSAVGLGNSELWERFGELGRHCLSPRDDDVVDERGGSAWCLPDVQDARGARCGVDLGRTSLRRVRTAFRQPTPSGRWPS